MTKREIRRLKNQLITQAENLENQENLPLAESITTICAALLNVVEPITVENQNNDEALNRLSADYLRISTQAENFFRLVKHTDPEQIRQLTEARTKTEEQRRKIEMNAKELESVKKQLDHQKQKLEEQRNIQRGLEALARENSAEKLHQIMEDNERLEQQLNETIVPVQKQKKRTEKLKRDLEEAEAALRDVPEENRRLLKEFQKKQKQLQALQNAVEECSQEKQDELQKEIDELQPKAEQSQRAVEDLRQRLDVVQNSFVRYDAEKQTLVTNVMEAFENSLGKLKTAVADSDERLTRLQQQADALAEGMEKCSQMRQRCEAWLDADKTPLEKLIKAVDIAEQENLRATLDVSRINRIRVLEQTIRDKLTELDSILERCIKATEKDWIEVQKRARP